MRIAVWHNLPSGGGKRALYDHLRGLHSRGHFIEIWCPPTADRQYLPLAEFGAEHVVDLEWPVHRNWRDKFHGRFSIDQSLDSMERHCKMCADQINKGSFDVLFANCCQFFRTTPIARFTNLPSVIYLGEPYRWLYEALPRLKWLAQPKSELSLFSPQRWRSSLNDCKITQNWRIQAREEFVNASTFGRILTNSFFSRESVLRAYGLDSTVCYLGTDTTRFKDLGLPREKFLIGIGSFTREKNISFAIQAVGLVRPPRPRLVWVGNVASTYLADMKTLAAGSGVDFEPLLRISDNEILKLLNRAIAMIYAPRLEPFGLAPIEAGACGLPVIAVAEGGVRESIVHNFTGIHVESEPKAAAQAIERLMADETTARRLGNNARSHIEEHWSLDALTMRIEEQLLFSANSRCSV